MWAISKDIVDISQHHSPVQGFQGSCTEMQCECLTVNPQRIKVKALTEVRKLVSSVVLHGALT